MTVSTWMSGPVLAAEQDDTIYRCRTILCSSNQNRNGDVFLPSELAKSQKTPIHKSANLNHESENIVGHVVDAYLVDRDHNRVDGVPDYCHLLVENIIYKTIGEKADQLIREIEAGQMFVSMECLFTDFDYLLSSSASQQFLIRRDDESRWLTQYLQAFGGTGVYDGYKVGRVLRNVVFVANGFVKTPANPGSVVVGSGDGDGWQDAAITVPSFVYGGTKRAGQHL